MSDSRKRILSFPAERRTASLVFVTRRATSLNQRVQGSSPCAPTIFASSRQHSRRLPASSEPIAAATLAPLILRVFDRPFWFVVAHVQKLHIYLHCLAHFGRDKRWPFGFNSQNDVQRKSDQYPHRWRHARAVRPEFCLSQRNDGDRRRLRNTRHH